jgi:hypothetical protein
MDLLKSEVKLLLLRNKQLENENYILKNNQIKQNINLINEKQLNQILENIKLAQNEYISKLNNLLIELTQQNAREDHYLALKQDINQCVRVCQQLQKDYEISKFNINNNNNYNNNNKSIDEPNNHLIVTQKVCL